MYVPWSPSYSTTQGTNFLSDAARDLTRRVTAHTGRYAASLMEAIFTATPSVLRNQAMEKR